MSDELRDPARIAGERRRDVVRVAQEARDAYERSRIGGLFFVATWILMCVTAREDGAREWLIGAGFLALSLSRLLVGSRMRRAAAPGASHLAATYAIMIATMFAWGSATAFALLHPDYAETPTVILFATSAFTTAYVHNYPMRMAPALAGLFAGYVPPALALVFSGRDGGLAVATGVAIHTAYLVLMSRRAHYEYHRSIDLEQELRAQRDAFSRRSRIDALTGLANRGEFAERLADAVADAGQGGAPLALLIVDLDHFKAINDARGHAAGDACLVAVAERLRAAFEPPHSLPARLGGEEFGVLLRDVDLDVAHARAELFRIELASRGVACGDAELAVTASVGVGRFDPLAHADADSLYRAVDAALYRAKHEGRNRVARVPPPAAANVLRYARPEPD